MTDVIYTTIQNFGLGKVFLHIYNNVSFVNYII